MPGELGPKADIEPIPKMPTNVSQSKEEFKDRYNTAEKGHKWESLLK